MVHPSRGFKPQKKAEAQKAPEASPGRNVRPSVGLVVRTRVCSVHFVVPSQGVHFVVRTRDVLFVVPTQGVHFVVCTQGVHFVVRTWGVHFVVRTQGGYTGCALCCTFTGCALCCSYTGCAFSSYVRSVCTFSFIHRVGEGISRNPKFILRNKWTAPNGHLHLHIH